MLKNYAQEFPEYGITIYKLRSNFAIVYDERGEWWILAGKVYKTPRTGTQKFLAMHPDSELTISPTFSFGIAVNELNIGAYCTNAQSALEVNKDQSNKTTMYHESLDMRMLKKKNFELKKISLMHLIMTDLRYIFSQSSRWITMKNRNIILKIQKMVF